MSRDEQKMWMLICVIPFVIYGIWCMKKGKEEREAHGKANMASRTAWHCGFWTMAIPLGMWFVW